MLEEPSDHESNLPLGEGEREKASQSSVGSKKVPQGHQGVLELRMVTQGVP